MEKLNGVDPRDQPAFFPARCSRRIAPLANASFGRTNPSTVMLSSRGAWPNGPGDHRTTSLPGLAQIMHRLEVDPERRAGAKEARQPQGRVGRHRPARP